MSKDLKKVWVTWERQRRNLSMSNQVDAKLYELISNHRGLYRYFILSFRTIILLNKEKPDVLFCQNPSIVLSFIALLLKFMFSYKLVVDAHNAGVYPNEGNSKFLNALAKIIVKYSDLVIVTNSSLASVCKAWGGRPIVVADPLPDISPEDIRSRLLKIQNESFVPNFLFICSWSNDEPVNEVFSAARLLKSVSIRITGKAPKSISRDLPENITLLGFISEEDYLKELRLCDGVLVLTKRNDCLNCGAYEAVSAEKPGILSDKLTIKNYFSKGFLYSKNDTIDIKNKLEKFSDEAERLYREVKDLKQLLHESDEISKKNLNRSVEKLFG